MTIVKAAQDQLITRWSKRLQTKTVMFTLITSSYWKVKAAIQMQKWACPVQVETKPSLHRSMIFSRSILVCTKRIPKTASFVLKDWFQPFMPSWRVWVVLLRVDLNLSRATKWPISWSTWKTKSCSIQLTPIAKPCLRMRSSSWSLNSLKKKEKCSNSMKGL